MRSTPGNAPVGAGHARPGGVPWTGVCGKVQGRTLRGREHGATVERSETGERAMFAPAGQTTARACQLCWLTALVVRRQAPDPYRAAEILRSRRRKVPGRHVCRPYGCRGRIYASRGRWRCDERPRVVGDADPYRSGGFHIRPGRVRRCRVQGRDESLPYDRFIYCK